MNNKIPIKLLTDSIFEANGLSYAKSDPLNFVDPSGHFAVSTALALGQVITWVGGTTAITTIVGYTASKAATWLNNIVRGLDANTSSMAHVNVNNQFIGQNGAWARVGKNALNLTPIGDVADIASFAFGKDAFAGAMMPVMKVRSDFFLKNDFMSRGLGESSINFLKNSSYTFETMDAGYDYYQSNSDFFGWGN